jgi:serine protease DegS
VRPSTVALRIHRRTGVSSATGLVVESGGIIVTPAPVVSGARSVTAVEPDGTRQPATLVGTDRTSGLAVLRIDDDLPAAVFDNGDPSVGTVVMASTLRTGSRSHPLPSSLVYAGAVVSSGRAVDLNAQTTTFSATAVRTPLARDDLGCPLLTDNGHVAGMLEMTKGRGASTTAVFLPSELVLGVALQLVASGTVDHGSMGIETSNAGPSTAASRGAVVTSTPTSDGALVDFIDTGGPAALAGLRPGDIITGIDGYAVHSTAELRSRLYPDPPGTNLAVSFDRGSIRATVPLVLADIDGDAQADGSSP